MPNRFLLGMDVGASSGRCLLVNIDTKEIVTSSQAWKYPPALGTGTFGISLQTHDIWSCLVKATREALGRARATASEIAAVATTGQRHSTVVLDTEGRVLFSAPTFDARAAAQGITLAEERGAEIFSRTGHWPAPLFTGVRLQWLAQNATETFSRAHAVMGVSDWVTFRLSGEASVEASIASETMLAQVGRRDWARDVIDWLHLPQSLFPPVVSCGTRIGRLRAEAADELGLAPGTPIVVGGGDTQCGLLGAGATAAGTLGIVAGTTMPVQLVHGEMILDEQRRLWTSHHVVPRLWVVESNAGLAGAMLEWLAHMLYPNAGSPAGTLAADAGQSVPGARGVLSTLGTDIFNASQLSLPLGHLTLSHMMATKDSEQRRHVARSVLEGLACGLRANVDQLLETNGHRSPALYMAGGMTRSAFWCQLVSEVLNAEVTRAPTPETSALGAALCAGVGAGLFTDLPEAAEHLAAGGRVFTPGAAHRDTYDELYKSWLDIRTARAAADELAKSVVLHSYHDADADHGQCQRVDLGFRPRILVTASMDEMALNALRELGEVKYVPFREQLDLLVGDSLTDALRGYHVFVTEVDIIDADALSKLPDLRVVVTCRGNPVNVDINACTAHGVLVLGTPGRNAEAVADLTIAFILMLTRKLPEASQFLHEHGSEAGDTARLGMAFDRFCGRELGQKTIGIVGFGAIGKRVAARLHPFGARLLAYDPYIGDEAILAGGAEPASLDELLATSDFITLHAAVTDQSRMLLDAEKLRATKPGAFLINTARAALVNEAALVEVLSSGHLGGAALDVFSSEPPGADDPLLALPNVIATPHIAGNTVELSTHQGKIVVHDLARLLAGELPAHPLNPQALNQFSWTERQKTPTAEALEQLKAKPGPAVTDLDIEKQKEQAGEPSNGHLISKLVKIFQRDKSKQQPAEPGATSYGRKSGTPHAKARQHMEFVLVDFFSRMSADAKVQSFAKGKDLTVCYQIPDIDLGFYMCFENGTVQAGIGSPMKPPQFTLKMKAEVLDKLFAGSVSGPRLAMSGKLSFSGDTLKAMSMFRLEKDLHRLYGESREQVGGVSDALAELASSAEVVTPSPVSAAGDERDQLVRTVEEMYAAGVITSTGGNVSVRASNNPEHIWMTPNQLHKGELSASLMVRVDLAGNPIDPSARAPSSERLIHCSILRDHPAVNAVIHSHAPKATALALADLPFLPISTEAAFIGEIPRVPFMMPGTQDLASAVAEAIGPGPAVLMQNHGLVVTGSDLRDAAALTLIIEQTADKILTCYAVGKEPPVLPDELVQSLRELGQMLA